MLGFLLLLLGSGGDLVGDVMIIGDMPLKVVVGSQPSPPFLGFLALQGAAVPSQTLPPQYTPPHLRPNAPDQNSRNLKIFSLNSKPGLGVLGIKDRTLYRLGKHSAS